MALSSPSKPSRFLSPLKTRQLHRALKNLKLSMICGLLTILVLRGALGAGKFGTPAKDFEELKHQFERVHSLHSRKLASRVLTEVIEERYRPLQAIEAQAHSTNFVDAKVQSIINDELQGKYGNLDVKSTFDLTKPYALSPKNTDWDVQRRAIKPNYVVGSKPKMMLLTGYHPSACQNPIGDHYLLKFIKNKVDYCNLHGIEILYNSAFLEAELSGVSAKLRLLRKFMLTHPEVEWFWWMDSDALFADMAFELPMEKYENYNVVMHGSDDMIYKQKGLTSGSFLIRNCQWSLNMMDTWVPLQPVEGQVSGHSNSDDRPILAHFFIHEKGNSGEMLLPLEKSIFLHGYWKIPVEQSEEEMKKNHDNVGNQSRPFAMRFVGAHKLCKKGANAGDYNADLYLKYMERAFDIADTQLLQLNSVDQRKSSSSTALRRLRGGHNGVVVSHSDAWPDQSKHISHSST